MSSPAPACPACSKPLLSRMAKLCSWCSAPIPDAFRFSPEEARQIEAGETAAKEKLEQVEQARAIEKGAKTARRKTAAAAATANLLGRLR